MTFMRALAAVFAAGLFALGTASAQQYPNHPITMIVPFPPGGATDAIARIIQDPLQKALGQPIVVENIGGAGGMIAADKAAHATPDGYTILIHQVALAAGMTLYNKDLNFDAAKDFATVGLVNNSASTWAARPDFPANNFDEMLHWMKQPGQSVKIGHAGVGSYSHLVGVMIAQELGAKATQVPYRGAGPALIDLLAGQVSARSLRWSPLL
jgi:tripartite-type tricarboxylate transporter receptor subunit TctC